MFWVFHTWNEGFCMSAMKYRNNICQKVWIGHMACIKNANKKMERSFIMPKGQWGDHNHMLHTPHMTQVRNIAIQPIITF
jgi:hypothetical protein